jgi:hypothetical protein
MLYLPMDLIGKKTMRKKLVEIVWKKQEKVFVIAMVLMGVLLLL